MSLQRAELLTLLRGLLHELANGLTIVEGTVDALDDEEALDDELRKELSTDLSEVSTDLCGLMNRVRNAAGLGPLNRQHHRVEALLDGASKLAGLEPPVLKAAQQETIYGDEEGLTQLLAELLQNAQEAAPAAAAAVELRRIDDDHVQLTVADSGPGMSAQQLQQAPEPFFSTRMRRGAGLGLPIVRGIIEQHGGSLSLHSTPTATRATITLPAGPPPKDTRDS